MPPSHGTGSVPQPLARVGELGDVWPCCADPRLLSVGPDAWVPCGACWLPTLWGWGLRAGLDGLRCRSPLLPTLDFPKAVATSVPLWAGMCPPDDLVSLPGRAVGCCCVPARPAGLVRAKADAPSPPNIPLLIRRILAGALCLCLSSGAVWLPLLPISCPGLAAGRNGLSLRLWPAALCWLCKARGKCGWIWGVNLIRCSSSPFNAKIPL